MVRCVRDRGHDFYLNTMRRWAGNLEPRLWIPPISVWFTGINKITCCAEACSLTEDNLIKLSRSLQRLMTVSSLL